METFKLSTSLINGIAISFSTKGSKANFSGKVIQTKSETTEETGKKKWPDYWILQKKSIVERIP